MKVFSPIGIADSDASEQPLWYANRAAEAGGDDQ
jgi:hypothetical protein